MTRRPKSPRSSDARLARAVERGEVFDPEDRAVMRTKYRAIREERLAARTALRALGKIVLDVELERRADDDWVALVPGLGRSVRGASERDVRRRLDAAVSEKIALDPIGVLHALNPRGRKREKLRIRLDAAG